MTPALKPFLKWPGGKRWLFDSQQFCLPHFAGRYIEPFLGGGAVFFENRPERAILGDSNQRLIELFSVIRDQVRKFEDVLRQHADKHSREYYYDIRAMEYNCPIERAAQFLYLNRTCWNGLYRENRKGQFNVPIGTKSRVIFETDDFAMWADALQGKTLACQDFEETIDTARRGDFIFVDPPYTVMHNNNGFVKYNQNIFAWDDQIRLRDALQRALKRGAMFAMTNADHPSVRDLFGGIGNLRQLKRHSVIAGSAAHRVPSTELLITG